MKRGISIAKLALSAAAFTASLATFAEARTIVFNEDRAQHYMTSKTYELKYTRAHDMMPFVRGAVKRFDGESSVQSVDYAAGGKQYLVVSTGNAFMPYVDEMIATLDYPSTKIAEDGSRIDGDGISRYTYCPLYRGSANMLEVLAQVFESAGGEGAAYYHAGSNMFYFKSSKSQGDAYLALLEALDKPVPQVEVTFHVYAMSEDNFRELGIDYLSWKNGPGANLLATGFDYADFNFCDPQVFEYILGGSLPSSINGVGGIMVAPNIDATFLRMLAQNGKAWSASSGSLTLMNSYSSAADDTGDDLFNLSFSPEFQNIVKDEEQTVSVGSLSDTTFEFVLDAPSVNFIADPETEPGKLTLMTSWALTVNSLADIDNLGTVAVDSNSFASALTLDTGSEKLLAAFDKHIQVEQYNGMPFLSEIPVLKYLFGSESKVDSKIKVFVTMSAKPVVSTRNEPNPAAGKMIDAFAMAKAAAAATSEPTGE